MTTIVLDLFFRVATYSNFRNFSQLSINSSSLYSERHFNKPIPSLQNYVLSFSTMLIPSVLIIICMSTGGLDSVTWIKGMTVYELIKNMYRVPIYFGIALTAVVVSSAFINEKLSTLTSKGITRFVKNGLLFVAYATPFLYFDTDFSYDTLHYSAYIGPANSVWLGGIPLHDVFCQYGLGYLVFIIGFMFLGTTFAAAAAFHSFFTGLYLLLYVAILRRFISNSVTFTIFSVVMIGAYCFFRHYPFNMTPSHGALRYFPAVALTTSLVYLKDNRKFTILTSLLLLLSALWNFESLIYGIIVYSAYLLFKAAADQGETQRVPWKVAIKDLLNLWGLLISGLSLICLIYIGLVGAWPRYDLYLSLVSAYLGPVSVVDYISWESGFFLWIPVFISYISILIAATTGFFGVKFFRNPTAVRYGTVAALGLAMSSIFVQMSSALNLMIISLPFSILFFACCDACFRRVATQREMKTEALSLVVPLCAYLILMVAFIMVHTPYPTLWGAIGNALSNKKTQVTESMLTLNTFCDKGGNACRPDTGSSAYCARPNNNDPACLADPAWKEIHNLVSRFASDKKRITIIHPWQFVMLIDLKKRHVLPISCEVAESLSKTTREFILSDLSGFKTGDIIFEGKKSFQPYEIYGQPRISVQLLTLLSEHWNLKVVEEHENFYVKKLVPKNLIS